MPQSDSRRFVYDRFGNRTAMYNSTSAPSPAAQTISLQPLSGQSGVSTNRINQVTATGAGTVTYAHDRAGNVRNDGVTAYTFDVLGRIDSATTGATMSTFQYDSANRRIQKKVGSSPAIDYVWEGGHVLAEYDRATGVYTDYVWAGSRMVASVRGAATTFHHQDRLSTRLSTDASGNVIGTQSHFPFGEDAGTSGTVEKHRFTTYEHDTESGTEYAMNRQNESDTGRFTRPDPVGGSVVDPQSLNRYAYAMNAPTDYVDPEGLSVQVCVTGYWESYNYGTNTTTLGASSTVCYVADWWPQGQPVGPGDGDFGLLTGRDLERTDTALAKARELVKKKDCDQALAKFDVPSLAALVSKLAVNANVYDGRISKAGYKGTGQSIASHFATMRESIGAEVIAPRYGGAIHTDNRKVFLNHRFFEPASNNWIGLQRGVILIHEAVHLIANKEDQAFGGSRQLTDAIVAGCYPVLAGQIGNVG